MGPWSKGLWVLRFTDDRVDGFQGRSRPWTYGPINLWTYLWTYLRTYPRASIRAHASLSVTVRLNTGLPGAVSGSTAK